MTMKKRKERTSRRVRIMTLSLFLSSCSSRVMLLYLSFLLCLFYFMCDCLCVCVSSVFFAAADGIQIALTYTSNNSLAASTLLHRTVFSFPCNAVRMEILRLSCLFGSIVYSPVLFSFFFLSRCPIMFFRLFLPFSSFFQSAVPVLQCEPFSIPLLLLPPNFDYSVQFQPLCFWMRYEFRFT